VFRVPAGDSNRISSAVVPMDYFLIEIQMIAQSPGDFLRSTAQVFAVFDERTQDSGNISYGVLAGDRRFFVKTAGMPENSKAHLSHEQRVALLRNAVSFRQHVNHQSLPKLLNVIESPMVRCWSMSGFQENFSV
jgi:hypothetical protein